MLASGPSTSKLVFSGALFALAALASSKCAPTGPGGGQTTTTSATVVRPDAIPSGSRTIDNAGFVDNAGRTSDMTNRTELSGMRATETGSQVPTGTPGSGLPLPIEPLPPRHDVGEGAGGATTLRGAAGPPPSGGPEAEAIPRIARARCDRETACSHVGPGRAWASQAACVAEQRERARFDISSAGCPRGIDQIQLAACLGALRGQACDDPRVLTDDIPGCRPSALCAQ